MRSRRRGALGALALVLPLGGLLADGAAARTWEDPVLLSPAAKAAISPSVGIDSSGDATAIWGMQDDTAGYLHPPHTIRMATRAAGGAWAVDLTDRSGPRARRPSLSVAGNGAAVASWLEQDSSGVTGKVWAMARGSSGGFGAATQLSGAGAGDNALGATVATALDSGGSGAVAWETSLSGTARLAVRQVSGGALAGSNATLAGNSQSFQTTRRAPDLAVGGAGPLVAFDRFSTTTFDLRPALYGPPGGSGFPAPAELAPTAVSPGYPAIAVAGGGQLAAAWMNTSSQHVYARLGEVEAPEEVSTGNSSAPIALAAAPDGTLLAAWRQDDDPSNLGGVHVYAAVRPSGASSFAAPVKLSQEGDAIGSFDGPVAGFAGNEAIVAWSRDTGSINRIEVSTRPSGGSFPAIADPVSGPFGSEDGDADEPALATNADGQAVLVWAQAFQAPSGGNPYSRIASSRSGFVSEPPPDNRKPAVTSFGASRERFAQGRDEGAVEAAKGQRTIMYPKGQRKQVLRVGTYFVFNSSEAGEATIRIKGTGCTRFLPAGKDFDEERRHNHCRAIHESATLKRNARKGGNRILYLGRGLAAGGDYVARLTVADAAENVSVTRIAHFSVDAKLP
ncbi:MAG: hypothetical protein U0R52_01450 [Solirubrobacterales bacterium]